MINIGNNSVGQRIADFYIAGSLLIHFIGGISVCKNISLVLHGYHILFDSNRIGGSVVYLDIAGTQINSEGIDTQSYVPP